MNGVYLGWSYFNMDETISEKARTLKAKVEKFNKDFAPEV
jgi:hypothetical protein